MVVFVDTSAIFAVADLSDPKHDEASRGMSIAFETGDELFLHNYVILESVALMTRRRGWEAVRRFLAEAHKFRIR